MRSRAAQIVALVEGDRNLRISFESGVGRNQIEEEVLQEDLYSLIKNSVNTICVSRIS